MILLDSNILIGYLNGDQEIVAALAEAKAKNQALFVSTISIAEVLSLSGASSAVLKDIENFLDTFIALSPDIAIAKMAASLRRRYRLQIPDAFIVATALINAIPLATRDRKLRKVPNLVSVEI